MTTKVKCPSCQENSILHSPWKYAGWPSHTTCSNCHAKVRSRATGFVSTFAQVIVGILIVLAYTWGDRTVYTGCLTGGFILLFFLPYFGTYEVVE